MMENKNETNQHQNFGTSRTRFWRKIVIFFKNITNIQKGSDQIGTINSIMANKTMTGANIWLLFASIIMASIGLDMNSPSVVIGAMLISPLMSPILGIGLSVAINNRTTLRTSLNHFGIAIIVSLITSFLYFLLTPFSNVEPTSEILGRTSPTVLDVGIAFFGGIAGIVSGTRLEKSNAIPGVAIATALLPPLCVAGYGLAHHEWWIFINAFYLFFINSVFVALATYLIVRLLDFPSKKYLDEKERNRSKLLIIGFVILIIVPSTFIFFNVLKDLRQKQFVKKYVFNNFKTTMNDISKIEGTDTLELIVFWFGKPMNSTDSLSHAKILAEKKVAFIVIQSNYGQEFTDNVRASVQSEELLKALNDEKKSKELLIQEKEALENDIADIEEKANLLSKVNVEFKKAYPELERLSFGTMQTTTDSADCVNLPTLSFKWNKKVTKKEQVDYEKRIAVAFRERFQLDTIVVGY